jgi:hypothetical protein
MNTGSIDGLAIQTSQASSIIPSRLGFSKMKKHLLKLKVQIIILLYQMLDIKQHLSLIRKLQADLEICFLPTQISCRTFQSWEEAGMLLAA